MNRNVNNDKYIISNKKLENKEENEYEFELVDGETLSFIFKSKILLILNENFLQ